MKEKLNLSIGKEVDFLHYNAASDTFIEGRGVISQIAIGHDGFKNVSLRTNDYDQDYIQVYASGLNLKPEDKEQYKIDCRLIKDFVIQKVEEENALDKELNDKIFTPRVKKMQEVHKKKKVKFLKSFNFRLSAMQHKLHGYRPKIVAPEKADK